MANIKSTSNKQKSKIPRRVIFNTNNSSVFDPADTSHVRVGKYAHFCYDNDELLIDENDKEFKTCTCGVADART